MANEKAVLISIRPKWCELIAAGRKTLELRKSVPNIQIPFKCYIYQTKKKWIYKVLKRFSSFDWAQSVMSGQTNVIGEFTCDYILRFCHMANADIAERVSCVRREEIFEYSCGKEVFGWHISDLKVYDKPKALTDFAVRECIWNNIRNNGCVDASGDKCLDCRLKRPPQSWCYVEEVTDG